MTTSFCIIATAIILSSLTGYLFDFSKVPLLPSPQNTIYLVAYLFLVFIIYSLRHKTPLCTWLQSVPCAIATICFSLFLALLKVLMPEASYSANLIKAIGLDNVTQSPGFLVCMFILLTSLSLITIKRTRHFTLKDSGFILNHFGCWLILVGALFGAGDIQQVHIVLKEGEKTKQGKMQEHFVQMPFSLKLDKFSIEEYPLQITLVNMDGKLLKHEDNKLLYVKVDEKYNLLEWEFYIKKYLDTGILGAEPAVFVEAKNLSSNTEVSGWISPGNSKTPPRILQLIDNDIGLALRPPQIKAYNSKITAYPAHDSPPMDIVLSVNQPVQINGWDLYQYGYDKTLGSGSQSSIILAVADPWLPIVYTGIFLLCAGAIYMIFWAKHIAKEAK